jgi:hypothetical protein
MSKRGRRTKRVKRARRAEAPLRGYSVIDGGDTGRVLRALALDDDDERDRLLDELAARRRERAAEFVEGLLRRGARA